MVLPPISTHLANIAYGLACGLLETAAGRVHDVAFGDEKERALRDAYQQAFGAMLQSVAPQMSEEQVHHLDSLLNEFIKDEEIANILLDIALKSRELPLSELRTRFEGQGFDAATLSVDFDTAMEAFVEGLAGGLRQEAAQPDSPLYNWVSLELLDAVREDLRRVYDLEQPRSRPPTHEAPIPGALIPHNSGIGEQSVGDRHSAIEAALDRDPLVVVCGPSGRGKSWEVARLARSRADSHETRVLWLSLDKGDALDSILSPVGKLAGRLRALRIPFEVDPQSSAGDREVRLLTTLQSARLLVCFDDYHKVEESYRDGFKQLFLRMPDWLEGSPTHVVVINRHPIPDLPSIELDTLEGPDVAQWIKDQCPECESSHWITDGSKAVELATILKRVCQDNYFAMKNSIEQMFKEGISYPEAREWVERHAPEALGKAILERVPQVVRTSIFAQQVLLGFVSIDAILVSMSQDEKEDIVQAIDWLTEGGILEPHVELQTYYTLRAEAWPYFECDPEEDTALLGRMAEHFESEHKYAEACKLYLAAQRFDQAIALLSGHSLDLRNRGLADRMLDLIDGVNRDMLEDWLNKVRLQTIRADFLAWTGKLDEAEDLAKIGLTTIEARSEEDRRQCRLEEIKLWVRRGIPSARRGDLENAYECFKKAEPLLLDYQETIGAKPEASETERLSVVEQDLILKNNLGLVYLNLALKQRRELTEGEEAQEIARKVEEAQGNARKAKEAFKSGSREARAQAYTNRSYRNYLNHLAAWLELQLARYYEQWEEDYERAEGSYASALSTLKEIGASSAAVNCANSMAVGLAGADHFEEALKYAEESRRLAEEMQDREGVAMVYATVSYDIHLARAKQTEDVSKKREFITKAREAFDLSWDREREIESADLLYAWQDILTDLIDLQGEQADAELRQRLERVERSIRMLEDAD